MQSLIVGIIRKPHGVRGEVRVAVETDRPERVFAQGRTVHLGDKAGKPVGRELVLAKVRQTPDSAIIQFEDCHRREDVEALRGHTLLIPAEEAAPPGPDEVHYRDLIGLTVFNGENSLGKVTDIVEIQSGRLLTVRPPEGKEILVPLIGHWIREVDVSRGVLTLHLPDGFLDI